MIMKVTVSTFNGFATSEFTLESGMDVTARIRSAAHELLSETDAHMGIYQASVFGTILYMGMVQDHNLRTISKGTDDDFTMVTTVAEVK